MDEPLTTVATFQTPVEAELARNRLEEKGIAAVVVDAETVGMLFHMGGALGGVKVQVAESDAAHARAVLAARPGRTALSADDDYGSEDRIQERAQARLRHHTAEDDEEESEEIETESDATAGRAWRSAVIGLLMLPPLLHFYSAWLLFQLPWTSGALSPVGKRKAFLAGALDVLVLAAVILFMRSLLLPPPPRPRGAPPVPVEQQRPAVPFPGL